MTLVILTEGVQENRFTCSYFSITLLYQLTKMPCLSPWERWPSIARTERANRMALAKQCPLSHLRRQLSHGESQGAHLP
jgi:hypothetical protein